ncbi:MAG: hypothetical protein KDG54_17270 [Geminicoccaceae bacterium]|nr:hypothetical protein [Geminicoccaceae bacterium]
MAALTLQTIALAGIVPAYSAVNSQDTVKVNTAQRNFLHVKNGGGGSINVTITAVKTSARVQGVGTVSISDEVVAVAAGAEKIIGPFTEAYMDTDGTVTIDYSGTTSVTAGVFSLPAGY